MKDTPHVLTERKGAVGLVTISRPDKRNALDRATHGQLLAAFAAMQKDRKVRVVVLTSRGGSPKCPPRMTHNASASSFERSSVGS